MIVSVISDTHIPRRGKDIPQKAYEIIDRSDLLIHAGDILSTDFLGNLSRRVETRAVLGNNDEPMDLPLTLEFELEGVNLAVIHDSGQKKGRRDRMRNRFPSARIIIYGHSHEPECSDEDGLLMFNPGSPTDRRRQPYHTMGLLEIENGEISGEIIILK